MCDIKEYGILEIMGEIHNSATTPKTEPILPNEWGDGCVTDLVWTFTTIEEWYRISSGSYPLPYSLYCLPYPISSPYLFLSVISCILVDG